MSRHHVAGLGLALALAGCAQSPPVINVTIVMPAPAPAKPEPRVEQASMSTAKVDEPIAQPIETQSSVSDPVFTLMPKVHGYWPDYGWRVLSCVRGRYDPIGCTTYGPPLEHVEQCHIMAKAARKEALTGDVHCEWTTIDPQDHDPNHRSL